MKATRTNRRAPGTEPATDQPRRRSNSSFDRAAGKSEGLPLFVRPAVPRSLPVIQRLEDPDDDTLMQTKPAASVLGAAQRRADPAGREPSPANGSSAMPRPLTAGLEALSGVDLSAVRVHHNSAEPAQLNALAYTKGQDIHLGPGQEKHLPHEGWHAVQQMQGRVRPTTQARGVSINDDEDLEREADLMGSKALQMRPEETTAGSVVRPWSMPRGQEKLTRDESKVPGRALWVPVQRAEKIKKADVRIFLPSTQISATEVAILAEKTIKASGGFDLVISSGSKDASFKKVLEGIGLFVIGAMREANFRMVVALDFSKVDWKKAGVSDASTVAKFSSGLHAFELIRWDKGKKIQLQVNYLKEVAEVKKSDYAAKIKKGKTNFSTAGFSFATPTAAQKKAGYKTWPSGEKNTVYMAVSRMPVALLKQASVQGISFYRVEKAGGKHAQYDHSTHQVLVGDSAFEVQEGKNVLPLATPGDLYKQSSAISGDATTGFTSRVEHTIIHEVGHSLDWGPIRPEVGRLIAVTAKMNTHVREVARIDGLIKGTKDAKTLAKLRRERKAAEALRQKAAAALIAVLNKLASKTTLSGSTYTLKGTTMAETNPAAKTSFEKAIAGKTSSTIYAGQDSGEAFAEGLTMYIVNPDLLKTYRPKLHAYFLKLLPPNP